MSQQDILWYKVKPYYVEWIAYNWVVGKGVPQTPL